MKLPFGQAAFNSLLNTYRQNAKNKEIDWKLSKEDFQALTKGNCFYCGVAPSREWIKPRHNGSYRYNGVDRLDSNKGYELSNVVSCCGTCNLMKNTQSVENFIRACQAVVNHQSNS